jgi:hypothetical protein
MLFRLAEIEKEMNEVGLKHGLLKTFVSRASSLYDAVVFLTVLSFILFLFCLLTQ